MPASLVRQRSGLGVKGGEAKEGVLPVQSSLDLVFVQTPVHRRGGVGVAANSIQSVLLKRRRI